MIYLAADIIIRLSYRSPTEILVKKYGVVPEGTTETMRQFLKEFSFLNFFLKKKHLENWSTLGKYSQTTVLKHS